MIKRKNLQKWRNNLITWARMVTLKEHDLSLKKTKKLSSPRFNATKILLNFINSISCWKRYLRRIQFLLNAQICYGSAINLDCYMNPENVKVVSPRDQPMFQVHIYKVQTKVIFTAYCFTMRSKKFAR